MAQKPKLGCFSLFGHLKGKFTLHMSRKHLKIAEPVSLGVLQHPTKFQVKIFRGKKVMEDFPYN